MGKTFNMTGGSGGGGGGGITLSSIAITTPPTKTSYQVGDTFDPTGMVVTATYTNGATLVVGGYTVSPQTMTLGVTAVTVSYTEGGVTKTATQAVTVTQYDATLEVTVTLVGTGGAVASVTATSGGATTNLTYNSGTGKWTGAVMSGNTYTVTATNSKGGSQSTSVSAVAGTNTVALTLGVLPNGYMQLEYVVDDGTAYCTIPDFTFPTNPNFKTTFSSEDASQASHSFAAYNSAHTAWFRCYGNSNSNRLILQVGAEGYVSGGTFPLTEAYTTGTGSSRTGYVNSGAGFSLSNNTQLIPLLTGTAYFVLCGLTNNEGQSFSANNTLKGKQGELIIYGGTSGSTEYYHFVPAKNSNNVVGFYDTINEVWHAPAAGSFTAGPAV